MLLRWIEKTREKPRAVRNQYAFVGAFVITACIVIVWAISLPTKFAQIAEKNNGPDVETVGAFSKFFSEAKDNFAATIQGTSKEETVEETAVESNTATTTKKTPVLVPDLSPETVEDVQEAYREATLPAPRQVLIETVSKDHRNTTTTDQ